MRNRTISIFGSSPVSSGIRSSSTMISVPSRSTTGRSAPDRGPGIGMSSAMIYCRCRFRSSWRRKDPNALAGLAGVVQRPELRTLVFHIPAMILVRNEKTRSLARDFSSSRRAPPRATSNLCWLNACFSASVFMISVWRAEPLREQAHLLRQPVRGWCAQSDQARVRPYAGPERRSSRETSRSCRHAES